MSDRGSNSTRRLGPCTLTTRTRIGTTTRNAARAAQKAGTLFSSCVLLEDPLVEGGSQDETHPWDDEMEVDDAVDESRVIALLDAADQEAEQVERAERAVSIGHSRAGSSGDAAEAPEVYRPEEAEAVRPREHSAKQSAADS